MLRTASRRLLPLLMAALGLGCAHHPTTAELEQVYRTGMARAEAAEVLGEPLKVATRPESGWVWREGTAERIGAFATRYERAHGATVQTCEVYWVPRAVLGVYWDYLFYGADDRLLGFHRQFID